MKSPLPTLAETARALRQRETTAERLTEQALERARDTQPTLNSFIEIWADQALAQARDCDREIGAGRYRGALHGIPLAHKDCFQQAGHVMTVGSHATPPEVATRNAAAIERLNAAGAVNLGKLNLNEMVAGPTGQNPYYGDCANALDPSRISGGSSSGSGASVAAGIAFASLGSDTGGSIRLPASAHGLFGLKPTYGRVSRRGSFPRAFSLDCIGPLARTAEDCALVLRAIAGWDRQDPSSLNAPVPDYAAALSHAADGSRLGVLDLGALPPCDPQVAAAFEQFVARAARHFGAAARASFPQLETCYAMGDVISKVEAATLHGAWMRDTPERYSQAVYSRTEPGLHLPAARYLETLQARASLLRAMLDGPLAQVDILMCPTIPIPIPLRTEADTEAKGSVFSVVPSLTRLTRPFSYLGLPVLTMPMGRDAAGMPMGVQLIGRPLAEARLLSFAHRLSVDH